MAGRVSDVQRWADRWVGPGLVMGLGAWRRAAKRVGGGVRACPGRPGHVVLLRSACLGDTILASGLVDDLRAAFAGVRVTLAVGRDNAGVAEMLGADEVVVLPVDRPWRAAGVMRGLPRRWARKPPSSRISWPIRGAMSRRPTARACK